MYKFDKLKITASLEGPVGFYNKHHKHLTEDTRAMFISFPQLPVELRLLIWKFALCTPRVIAVEVGQTAVLRPRKWKRRICVPKCTPSPLRAVNAEARREAEKFQAAHHEPKYGEPPVFANFEVDTLWFTNWNRLENFVRDLAEHTCVPDDNAPWGRPSTKLRNIAMPWYAWSEVFLARNLNDPDMAAMNERLYRLGIEEIILVVHRKDEARSTTADLSYEGSFVPPKNFPALDEQWPSLLKTLILTPPFSWSDVEARIRRLVLFLQSPYLAVKLTEGHTDQNVVQRHDSGISKPLKKVPRFRFMEFKPVGGKSSVRVLSRPTYWCPDR